MANRTTNIILMIMSAVSFIAALVLAFSGGKKFETGLFIAAAIAFLIMKELDRLKEFTGLGVKAVLQEKVAEADKVLAELREISLLMSKLTLNLVTRMGRWGTSFSHEEKLAIEQETRAILKKIGINDKQFDEAISETEWDFHTVFDILSPIASGLKTEIRKLMEEGHEAFKRVDASNKSKHDEWLERRKVLGGELQKLESIYNFGSKKDAGKMLSQIKDVLGENSPLPHELKEKSLETYSKHFHASETYIKTRQFPADFTYPETGR